MFGMRVSTIGFPPKSQDFNGRNWIPLEQFHLEDLADLKVVVNQWILIRCRLASTLGVPIKASMTIVLCWGGLIVNVVTGIIISVFLVYQNGETYFSRIRSSKMEL
jgi:regulator of sigma E protease